MKKRANGEGTIYFDEKKQLYRAMLMTPAGKRMTKSSKDESIVKGNLNFFIIVTHFYKIKNAPEPRKRCIHWCDCRDSNAGPTA